jgi:predicted TIM-barrel fold metal-dependent hydrolase
MADPGVTWDCHVHVFEPGRHLAAERAYTPEPAPVDALAAHLAATGAARAVIVQPSPYGADNAATLGALAALGPAHRAVIAPGPSVRELLALRERGVRGLRLNPLGRIAAASEPVRAGIAAAGLACAGAGLALELSLAAPALAALRDTLAALPCPLVLPHFAGLLDPAEETVARGELARLFARGQLWVKVSALDRFVPDAPDFDDRLGRACAFLAEHAPARILYGSDWPHTPFHGANPTDPAGPGLPHREVDLLAACHRLEAALGSRLWRAARVDNPEELYA